MAGRGNPKGVNHRTGKTNNATLEARRAIADFVDGNAHRLQEWLDQVAAGVYDETAEKWVVQPNPDRAFTLFQTVIEYHVPKLARTEVVGDKGGPVQQNIMVSFVEPSAIPDETSGSI
jgi:hypothetical protein